VRVKKIFKKMSYTELRNCNYELPKKRPSYGLVTEFCELAVTSGNSRAGADGPSGNTTL